MFLIKHFSEQTMCERDCEKWGNKAVNYFASKSDL